MRTRINHMTRVSLMAAVLCVLGPFTIPIGPVPVSLSGIGIYLAVYLLGSKSGGYSIFLYLLMGLTGLPVFSGFSGGIGKLIGPTGGYLLGYLPAGVISGRLLEETEKRRKSTKVNFYMQMLILTIGNILLYLFGTAWLMMVSKVSFGEAAAMGIIPFLIPDFIKNAAVILLGERLKERIKDISFD